MWSDWQEDDPRSFWRGALCAVALGSAAWLGGLAFAAFVVWRMGRIG